MEAFSAGSTPPCRAVPGRTRGASGDLLLADERADRVARLCAVAEPVLDSLCVQLHLRGVLERVVRSHNLNEAAVARAAPVNHHHAVERLLLLSNPG